MTEPATLCRKTGHETGHETGALHQQWRVVVATSVGLRKVRVEDEFEALDLAEAINSTGGTARVQRRMVTDWDEPDEHPQPEVQPEHQPGTGAESGESEPLLPSGPNPLALARRRQPLQAQAPLHQRTSRPTGVVIEGVSIAPRVVEIIEQHQVTYDDIVDAALEPQTTWRAPQDNAEVRLGAQHAVLVADDNGEVIAVIPREIALRERHRLQGGGIPRKRGGSGNRFPTDTKELVERFRAAGFEVSHGGKHYKATHPSRPGQPTTFPVSPSDHRSIKNAVLEARREFGIDLRQTRA